tara:strand:+ start:55859 stop:57748 length:1890 start_codon:yes stop_codon:yes gene_type:complete
MGHIKSLYLKNYVFVEETSLEFGPGPFFMVGHNLDETSCASNGAGKSLICESILWILFERIRDDTSVKDVVGEFGSEAVGRVAFEHKGSEVVIERRRKASSSSNVSITVDGKTQDLHKDPESKITELLGFPKNTLIWSSYGGLEGQKSLVSYTDSALKSEVMRLLDLERFKSYRESVKEELKKLKSELDTQVSKVTKSNTILEELEADIQSAYKELSTFNESQDKESAEIKSRIFELESKITKLREDTADPEQFSDELASLEENLQKRDVLKQRLGKAERVIRDQKSKISRLKSVVQGCQDRSDDYKRRIDNLVGNQDGHCEYCGNDLSDSPRSKEILEKYNAAFKKYEADKLISKVDLEEAESKLAKMEEKEKTLKSEYDQLESSFKRKMTLERELDKIKMNVRLIRGHEETIKGLNESLERVASRDKSLIHDRIDKLESRIDKRTDLLEAEEKVMDDLESKISALEDFKKAIWNYRDAVFNGFAVGFQQSINKQFMKFCSGDFDCVLDSTKKGLSFKFSSISKDKYYGWGVFSLGERGRIDKAVSLALMDLMDLPFRVEDEVFHGVDDTGPALNSMLESSEGKTLIYISHQPHTADFFKRFNRIIVTKENGVVSAKNEYGAPGGIHD